MAEPVWAALARLLRALTERAGTERDVRNKISGTVEGNVVQSGTIKGSVIFDSSQSVTINQYHQAAPDALTEAADQLAVALGRQWEDEAELRRVNDQNALPVSWEAADADLVEDWPYVVSAATDPSRREGSAAGPSGLAGTDGGLASVLQRVPSGRLVVLGEPGSGKTVLLVRLVLDLLDRRRVAKQKPVPVLLSLASWNPAEQDMRTWLLARLAIDHPGLAAPAPSAIGDLTLGQALLADRLLLPVLDGLDEIPEALRGQALAGINDSLHAGDRLVVSCRTEHYRQAVNPPGGVPVKLRGAAAVVLHEPDTDAARDYLLREAGGPSAAADRWTPVLACLGTANSVGLALRTPLLISMASIIYNPRPGERLGSLPDPAELCDTRRFPTHTRVEEYLFDAFIPAAYRHPRGARHGPWTSEKAATYLAFLARHLERDSTTDLAWWQLRRAAPYRLFLFSSMAAFAGVAGVGGAIATGLRGLAVGLGYGLLLGYTLGTALGKDSQSKPLASPPKHGVRWSRRRLRVAAVAGLVPGIAFGIPFGLLAGPYDGIGIGLVFASLVWLVVGLGTFKSAPADLTVTTSPDTVLARDRRTCLLISSVSGIVTLGLIELFGAWAHELRGALGFGLPASFLIAQLGLGQTAWPMYALSKCWLALRHHLPWRLAGFLADAHRRGVLRQAGAVYQFRHAQLQRRLATRT